MDLCILLVYLSMPLVLRVYNVSPEAEHYARQIVWMHGFMGMLFWPLSFTLPQALRAAGDTRFTMVVSSVSMWTMRVGFGILLGRRLGHLQPDLVPGFFEWDGDHRDLHSFPTRRSSDLHISRPKVCISHFP